MELAADLLVRPSDERLSKDQIALNSETFWQQRVEDVAADEVFFHSYFNQTSTTPKRKETSKKARDVEDESEDDAEEDEIWQAIANSKPEVEGPDEDDDDLSMGDLESAYSDSEAGSEPGLDLGGDDE